MTGLWSFNRGKVGKMKRDYLLGGKITYHALHFNMEMMSFDKIIAESQKYCPVCGDGNVLGSGGLFDMDSLISSERLQQPQSHVIANNQDIGSDSKGCISLDT